MESGWVDAMVDAAAMLEELYRAKLDDLRSIAAAYDLPRTGGVDLLRARLIRDLVLEEWDLSDEGLTHLKNTELGELLEVFGIKKTGSIRARRQRLYLHLNHDAKGLSVEALEELTKDDLQTLARSLDLQVSGSKQLLQSRIAGVLEMQRGAWGSIKRTLRREGGTLEIEIPRPDGAPEAFETKHETALEEVEVESTSVVEVDEGLVEGDDVDNLLGSAIDEVGRAVEAFAGAHPDGWTDGEETELRLSLQSQGVDVTRGDVAAELDDALREHATSPVLRDDIPAEPMPELPTDLTLDERADLEDLERRAAEVEASCRHFLSIGSINDHEDVEAFLNHLVQQGFDTNLAHVRRAILLRLHEVDRRRADEEVAQRDRPSTWRGREAVRAFEHYRPMLLEAADAATTEGDSPDARTAYLAAATKLGLDLAEPAVSGRVHALYDLHVDLLAERASMDPVASRRQSALRVLFHGSVHLDVAERRTLERLERGLPALEDLIAAVLDDSTGRIEPGHEALIMTYLERRGLEVNTPELRPRVMACVGVLAAELGLISLSEIPRLAPGLRISDDQIDDIVHELQSLAATFRVPVGHEEGEETAPTSVERDGRDRRVDGAKAMVDRADAILSRMLEER